MSTLEAERPVAIGRATPSPQLRSRTAVFALARLEGRRLVRQPLFLVGILAGAAAFVISVWNQAPVLQRDDIKAGVASLPLAAVTFLLANLAALRSRRHGTDELLEATPTSVAGRTVGHLLSVLWAAAAAAALVAGTMAFLWARRPVGSPSLLELAVGPAIVAVMGMLGVAVARWWRSAAGGPVALVGLAGIQIYLMFQLPQSTSAQFEQHLRWLAFWVPLSLSGDPAPELVVRPSGQHLLYLAAVAVVFAVVALLRHGPAIRPVAVGAIAVVVVIAAAQAETQLPTAAQVRAATALVLDPRAHQVCRTDLGVRYCAYPGYVGWIDRWRETADGVLDRVPTGRRPSELAVEQRLTVYGADIPVNQDGTVPGAPVTNTDSTITVPDQWGSGSWEEQDQLALALNVAARAVGLGRRIVLPTKAAIRAAAQTLPKAQRADFVANIKPGDTVPYCTTAGQARGVVALWLAAQATTKADAAFTSAVAQEPFGVFEHQPGSPIFGNPVLRHDGHVYLYRGPIADSLGNVQWTLGIDFPVLWGNAEAHYAAQLLRRPAASVSALLGANWAMLTAPTTRTRQVLRLLGLRPLPTPAEQLRALGLDPATRLNPMIGYEAVPCR